MYPPGIPWVVYAPLYIPVYMPSLTSPGTPASYLPGYVLHAQRPCGRFTALRQRVAELTVGHAALTVRHPFHCWVSVRHPFHCWLERQPPYRPVWGEGGMLRRGITRPLPVSLLGNDAKSVFLSVLALPWGYTLGLRES